MISHPVTASERLDLVDALRGFALAGVFFINLRLFSLFDFLNDEQRAALATAPYDELLLTVAQIFGDGKFISLFSMLFGLGFALQLQRLESRGADALRIYRRRALVLLGIGLVHGLLWFGDILRNYAILAFALLVVRRAPIKALVVAGVACGLGWALVPLIGGPEYELAVMQRSLDAFGSGSFVDAFRQNLETDWFFVVRYPGLPIFIFGRFLLGYAAGRVGLVADPSSHGRLLGRVCWIGWLSGVVATCAIGAFGTRPEPGVPVADDSLLQHFLEGVNALGFAVAYASTFILLYQRQSWHDLLKHLAPAGRMCLTNYLTQTLISVPLFYGWGHGVGPRFGMFGVIGTWGMVYGAQIVLSHWWLQRYQFGPAEWLWRSLTYGGRQPMALTPSSRAPSPQI